MQRRLDTVLHVSVHAHPHLTGAPATTPGRPAGRQTAGTRHAMRAHRPRQAAQSPPCIVPVGQAGQAVAQHGSGRGRKRSSVVPATSLQKRPAQPPPRATSQASGACGRRQRVTALRRSATCQRACPGGLLDVVGGRLMCVFPKCRWQGDAPWSQAHHACCDAAPGNHAASPRPARALSGATPRASPHLLPGASGAHPRRCRHSFRRLMTRWRAWQWLNGCGVRASTGVEGEHPQDGACLQAP